jgi:hypothetical protein
MPEQDGQISNSNFLWTFGSSSTPHLGHKVLLLVGGILFGILQKGQILTLSPIPFLHRTQTFENITHLFLIGLYLT